jgi:hypothetical protein
MLLPGGNECSWNKTCQSASLSSTKPTWLASDWKGPSATKGRQHNTWRLAGLSWTSKIDVVVSRSEHVELLLLLSSSSSSTTSLALIDLIRPYKYSRAHKQSTQDRILRLYLKEERPFLSDGNSSSFMWVDVNITNRLCFITAFWSAVSCRSANGFSVWRNVFLPLPF